MNKTLRVVALLLPSLLLATPKIASADGSKPASIALIPHTGTLGHGVDLSLPLAEKINLRLGFGRYTKTRDVTESDVSYTGKLTLGGGLLVADWFPFGGNFRLSGGLVKNQSKIEIVAAKPTGTVTLNTTTYNGSDISVNGKISYEKTVPYIGLGYGNPSARGRFGFFGEFGVTRQKPKATLSGTCTAGAACSTFQADLAAEQASLQEDANKEKWFPIIQLGMSVRF